MLGSTIPPVLCLRPVLFSRQQRGRRDLPIFVFEPQLETGAANGRQLTQSGPPPQTVYRVARKAGGPMLVTVPLRYAK
jgi:hypothetical protein